MGGENKWEEESRLKRTEERAGRTREKEREMLGPTNQVATSQTWKKQQK